MNEPVYISRLVVPDGPAPGAQMETCPVCRHILRLVPIGAGEADIECTNCDWMDREPDWDWGGSP